MTENESYLLNLIRNHDNPAEALVTAIEIILSFLEHHAQCESTSVVDPRV